MTPRKELFIAVKTALMQIAEFELVDLDRRQFQSDRFPHIMVSALIKISKISWETMTESNQEGDCNVEVTLYCRDGWMDQHNGTEDAEHGLIEIDLLDAIAEKLQFLSGDQFTKLQQFEDETEDQDMDGIFSYRQSFNCSIYRKLGNKYSLKKLVQ